MQLKRHRPSQLICDINVAGFVGVMLALLWMFMPMTTDAHRQMPVDIPKAVHPVSMAHASREDAMLVAVTRDGKVFFGRDLVRPADLPAIIQEGINRGSEREVYIRADAAKYAWVAEVLDNVRSTGIEKVGFLVDQKRSSALDPK